VRDACPGHVSGTLCTHSQDTASTDP